MTEIVHGFDWPDRFVTGTTGEPGARTFFLQAHQGNRLVSVALEKEQSAALADGVDAVLDQLMAEEPNRYSIPPEAPEGLADDGPLEEPVSEQFRAGDMRLAWDASTAQVVIQVARLVTEEQLLLDPDAAEETLVVRLPVGAARAFAERTRSIVSQGRPICPICEEAMDPEGHICVIPDDE